MLRKNKMLKKNTEENTNEEFEQSEEIKTEETVIENKTEKAVEEPAIEEPEKEMVALNSEAFTILRVDANGLFVADSNGNGRDIFVPKQYKIENLKAGDTILVSKSEL